MRAAHASQSPMTGIGHVASIALVLVWMASAPSAFAAPASADAIAARGILERAMAEPLTLAASQLDLSAPRSDRTGGGFSLWSLPIWTHQTLISPQDGDRCVFEPSCSMYAAQALRSRGLIGWPMAADRILRCHDGAHGRYPFEGGYSLDPVPAPGRPRLSGAGGVASLVPGLGQWLAGDHGDAAYALGSVALLAWGAAHYARRDEPAPAATLGGFAAFFYVGSVYGGARAMARRGSP
jgi:uncharacterized protein